MLRFLKLKPFRKLKVVQRLLERRQARKLRNESAADFATVEDEQQVAEQCRNSKSRPPAQRKVSGDDGASASRPAAPSRQRDRGSNEPDTKYGWRAPSDAPVDASTSAEATVTDAAVDALVCSERPYHVRTQAKGSGALEPWSPPPPPNPYDSDNGYDASPRAYRLRPDSGSNAAAEVLSPFASHTSHPPERSDAAASRDGSNVADSAGLQADASSAVARADRDDSSDHREIAQQRRSSNRARSGSKGRRDHSNVVDDQSAATPDCDRTDDAHERRPPTASAIATAPTASTLSIGATATDANSAAPASSLQPRLRRRHSMPARDRATGSSGDSTLQRLHRLRRSFAGGLRASKYTKLRSGDSQSVLGQEASADDSREPFSKALRRSFRESFRYGLQSLSAAGIGSGIGMAMAPSFAMPFGGLTTVV